MACKLEPISALFFLVLVACSNSVASSPQRHDDSGLTAEQGRQLPSNLDCGNYPELLEDNSECVNTFEIRSMINALVDPADNTDFNRNLLRATLDSFCNTQCYNNTIFYYTTCSESESSVQFYQNVACARNGDDYCSLALYEELASNDINDFEIELQCNTDESDICPRQACIDILEGISRSLGCCAGNLFNNSITSSSVVPLYINYEVCNLTLPAQCAGSTSLPAKLVVASLVLAVVSLLTL